MDYTKILDEINYLLEDYNNGINLDKVFNRLGILYAELNNYNKAIDFFNKAFSYNPNDINALINLGIVYGKQKQFFLAISLLVKAYELNNNNCSVCYNLAYAYQEIGEINKAIEFYTKSILLNPQHYISYFNRSLLYLLQKKYDLGFEEYFKYGYLSGDLKLRALSGKAWDGESLKGKTILVYYDQGFGDAINFVRFLPYLKADGANVIVEVQQPLYSLFKNINSYDSLIIYPEGDLVKADYNASFVLLSKYFLPKNNTIFFPYLMPNKESVLKAKRLINNDNKLKIGFFWKGNPYPEINNKRHIELNKFYKLFEIRNTIWYSLYPEKNEEIKEAQDKFINVLDITENIKDFNDTAAIIENLDLIVTIDSAVAHLAGAMNKKTCLMLNYVPDWRWGLFGESTDLYPSLKIFRQKEPGIWNLVIDEIYYYIKALL